jgi:hypothetical protein
MLLNPFVTVGGAKLRTLEPGFTRTHPRNQTARVPLELLQSRALVTPGDAGCGGVDGQSGEEEDDASNGGNVDASAAAAGGAAAGDATGSGGRMDTGDIRSDRHSDRSDAGDATDEDGSVAPSHHRSVLGAPPWQQRQRQRQRQQQVKWWWRRLLQAVGTDSSGGSGSSAAASATAGAVACPLSEAAKLRAAAAGVFSDLGLPIPDHQITLPRTALDSDQLRAALSPHAATRWLHLTDPVGTFKGFTNPKAEAEFQELMDSIAWDWCCRGPEAQGGQPGGHFLRPRKAGAARGLCRFTRLNRQEVSYFCAEGDAPPAGGLNSTSKAGAA